MCTKRTYPLIAKLLSLPILVLMLLSVVCPVPTAAQVTNITMIYVSAAPSGPCSSAYEPLRYVITTGAIYGCVLPSWTMVTTGTVTGIGTLGTLTDATQALAVGTSGTEPAWVNAAATHTINIPMASAALVTAGLISKTDYDLFATAGGFPALTGDTTKPLGSAVTTTVKVNGVAFPASPVVHQIPVVTSTGNVTWKTIGDCNGTGKALTFMQSSDEYGCNTITGSGGAIVTNTQTGTTNTVTHNYNAAEVTWSCRDNSNAPIFPSGLTFNLNTTVFTFSTSVTTTCSVVGGTGGGGGGSGTVNSGTANYLAYYASTGTAVSGLATGNNGVLVTNGSGVPSISATLPSGITLVAPVLGTVAAGSVLTNATGLPISTGVSGLGTGVGTFLVTPSGVNLASALTTALPNTKGGTGGDSSSSTGIAHVSSGTWSYSSVVNGDLGANAVDSAKMAVVNTRRVCDIVVGDTSQASAITNASLGPQKRICYLPATATVQEIVVSADAGTPSVIVGKNVAGTQTNILSGVLQTASSGGIACAKTSAVAGIDGTTCSALLTANTSIPAGAYLELVSGSGSTAKLMTIHVIYTID